MTPAQEEFRKALSRILALAYAERPLEAECEALEAMFDAAQKDAEIARLRAAHAESSYQRLVRVLTHIHALLHPPGVTMHGQRFTFKSPMLDEQVQALSDRIRAIPDEIAAMEKSNGN